MMKSVSGTLKSSLNCSFQTLGFCELYQERPQSAEVACPKCTRIGAYMITRRQSYALGDLIFRHMTK